MRSRTAFAYRLIGLAASLFAVLLPTGVGMAQTSGPERFILVERSGPVFDVLWKYGHVDATATGAYGLNVTASRTAWYLEEQRAGATDVIDGVLRHEPQLVAEGLRMFHFGLAREAPDGSFPGSAWPFHGTAMFLSEAGPALLVLSASTYAGNFAAEIAWQSRRMRSAAYYAVQHVGGPDRIDDRSKNHRYYEAAIALGAVGILTHDKTLQRWSTHYAWRGLQMERGDGVMPENGGHDSGYQALGMVSASRYLTLVATGSLYRSLYRVLQRGESWERSRIGRDGSINQAGDTRTVGCREHDPQGRCKTVFYAPIFSALARWAVISGDSQYGTMAMQVWRRSHYGG